MGRTLPFEVVAPLKVWAEAFREGRLKLKRHFYEEPVTFQDSCNFIRNAGYYEESRLLMRHVAKDLREMNPNGVYTYCCGNGGGHALMPEYKKTKLATARAKAECIKATRARIVVVACHNCEDGIRECVKEYGLDCKVELFSNYLAEAIDLGGAG